MYITNPGGQVHHVSREHGAELLKQQGFCTPTDAELAAYRAAHEPAFDGEEEDEDEIPDQRENEKDAPFLGRLKDKHLRMIAEGLEVAIVEPFDRKVVTAALLAKKAENDAAKAAA